MHWQLRHSLPSGISNVANNCYINQIMQCLSNHPKMTSVVDQLTPSHPIVSTTLSCAQTSWGKGLVTVECFLVLSFAKSAVSILNKPMELALHQKEVIIHLFKHQIASLTQPRKHSIVTRPFPSWECGVWGQDYCNWECHINIWKTSLFILSHTNRSNIQHLEQFGVTANTVLQYWHVNCFFFFMWKKYIYIHRANCKEEIKYIENNCVQNAVA